MKLKTKNSYSNNIRCKSQVNRFMSDFVRDKYLYLLLVPFLAYFIVFAYMPIPGLQVAFKEFSLFKGIDGSPWVGLENFKTFFGSPYFFRVLKNTLLISFYSILFGFPAPIILALLFNEVRNRNFKKFTQTLTYLPHFVSVVIVAGLITNFLAPNNGLVNLIIEKLGGEKVYFLTKPEFFRSIYVGMNIWKETGFNSIIYIAALSAIDSELYEAAVVDGAGRWKQLWKITIPGILSTIVIMLILRVGKLMEVGYETVILLYQPATYETADVISTYVYRSGLVDGNYSLATAVGLFNSLVALILVYSTNKFSKKISDIGIW